ncbi:LysR family transcriptional regulator [Stigmatella aurantiaca]|uniref:LysR family transcriptional regulatory protein n=1 Tax=Stigmatella aurantiaca (strain DW4/3-1) TaxID=378806 RepID=Q08NI4_STIAD|nr:LysR family transcriptional regulator [Stigmatella aurantiaca]ADO69245.1 Transcriptional regulator, LysR family protein [Stigmatella aurantiaca DW4/3-1]EAU62042.1 LysR family transcriptional regulatory protein [Stigmatella aurantiaca DW4/3-1]
MSHGSTADLNQMLTFARVVARGSFSVAARELHVPPSTLSRQVASLERRIGLRLLERTTRKLRLTEAGALYYERCSQIARDVEDADSTVRALSLTPRGTLRLSAPPVLGEMFLGPPLAEYVKLYRDMKVELSLNSRRVDLVQEGFDLAMRVAVALDDSSLMARRLGVSTRLLCASPQYVRDHGTPASLAELPAHPTISIGSGHEPWRFLDAKGEVIEVKVEPRVEVNSSALVLELCLAGAGLALIPSFLAATRVAEGSLVQVLPEIRTRPLEVLLLFPSSRQLAPKVRAFLDVVDRHIARQKPWS